jgi:2,3-dihydroxyphenylpropionate 1,2-dioxygenase
LRTASAAVIDKLIDNRNATPQEMLAREQANLDVARCLMRGEGNALPLNPQWDMGFMQDMAAGRLEALDSLGEDSLASIAGCGGHEVRTWVAAYAALGASGPYQAQNIFYQDIAAWNAGMGIAAARPKNL